MKILLILASVLLLITTALHAQKPVENLPELQEWYSWPGAQGSYISYLPNFDSANGGMNAITQKRPDNGTWYNRFAYDTTNQFTWGSSWIVMPVDFNGDGFTDYIDYDGNVYQGIKKNSPPIRVEGIKYEGFTGGEFVADFNNDGYEDIIVPTNAGRTFMILLGGKDLKQLRQMPVDYYGQSYSTGISAYKNEQGQPRLITYKSSDFSEGFYLYGLTFEGTPNDSIIVNLQLLDKIEELKKSKTEQIFYGNTVVLYENKKAKEYTLLVSYVTPKRTLMPFAIINDKFTPTTIMNITGAFKFCFSGSIDGDDTPDWINLGSPHTIYSGNPAKDGTPRAIISINNCNIDGSYFYIGDVTGDGIGDIALGNLYCFSIFKGVDWQKLSVIGDVAKIDFTLHQTEPNPIGSDGKAVLPATLAHSGNYTLEVYNLTGKRLGELFSGDLPSGEIRLPFDVKVLNIPAGMYTLRLSDGKKTQERAFVISR